MVNMPKYCISAVVYNITFCCTRTYFEWPLFLFCVVADVRLHRRQRNDIHRHRRRVQVRDHRELQQKAISAAMASCPLQQSVGCFGWYEVSISVGKWYTNDVLQEVSLQGNSDGTCNYKSTNHTKRLISRGRKSHYYFFKI